MSDAPEIVQLSAKKFLGACALLALAIVLSGRPLPPWVLGAEVLATIIALFVTGSIRYRLDKNALTYGAGLVVAASFWTLWNPGVRAAAMAQDRTLGTALWDVFQRHFLTFAGLDDLIHLDTMLFILGLTFFVAVIAQTRLLETASFGVLAKTKGKLVPTIAALTAMVSVASGVLDGVSMIGLMIRTLVILLFM
ncbi:MAG TPA: hypothetical protein PKB12_08755, partial [Elusimicrobiota bacterium]|nr:hypothetical protein [Elusimicrobiota bacterium]